MRVVDHVHSAACWVAQVRLVGVELRDGQDFPDAGRGPGDVGPAEVGIGAQAPRPIIRPPVVRVMRKVPVRGERPARFATLAAVGRMLVPSLLPKEM